MLTVEARIETERASRYLVQLCKHAASMGAAHGHLGGMLARREVQVRADWSDTRGTLTFNPWGECAITADANMLTLRIHAIDEQRLQRIEDVVTRDLERFGQRDHLAVDWHLPERPE
jgi:hypothetical protein